MSRSALIAAISVVAFVASLPLAVAQQDPARPWQALIPDPDSVDWSDNNRPGYRFRGMLPTHERFYEYVQGKRDSGQELSAVDRMMVRRLQAARRWPEPPEPNEFWKSFLRYLREQPSQELNTAQRMMYSEALAHGMIPLDPPQNEQMRKAVEYLSSRPFRARNWFERTFGRVEPWMDYYMASSGYDMAPASGPGTGVFPPTEAFNGMRIRYNVTGLKMGPPKDTHDFITKRYYSGTVAPGTITVSGTGSINSGWGATLEVVVQFGRERFIEKWTIDSPGSQDFSFTVKIPEGADLSFPAQQFWIKMTGKYSLAGAGSPTTTRGLWVCGSFTEDESAASSRIAAEDAAWREQVEKTLRELGYEETPAGRELAEMREASAGGDAAWKAYVDRKLVELGYQESSAETQFDEMESALDAGGASWEQYAAQHGGGGGGGDAPQATGTARPAQSGGAQSGNPGAGAGGGRDSAGGAGAPSGGEAAGSRSEGAQAGPAGGSAGTGGTQPGGAGASGRSAAGQELPDFGGLQVGIDSADGKTTGISEQFTRPQRLAATQHFRDVPKGSLALAVWICDGQELRRTERALGGSSGWVSFALMTQDTRGLPPGRYTLTISIGGEVLGRKSFTVVR